MVLARATYFDQAVADVWLSRRAVWLARSAAAAENHMPWRCRAGESGAVDVTTCDPAALPFASQSLDLLLLPRSAGFTSHPHRVLLREARRVLVPEGRFDGLGPNPISLWGWRGAANRAT